MPASRFPPPGAPGTIYLVHYSNRTARGHQHYLGWSSDVAVRFRQHRAGRGAHETMQAVAEGLSLTLAQTWQGTPELESRLKEWSRAKRCGFAGLCPFCPGGRLPPSELARALGRPSLTRYHVSRVPGCGLVDGVAAECESQRSPGCR